MSSLLESSCGGGGGGKPILVISDELIKILLDAHFKMNHITSSYLCSTCGHKTSSRNNYIKHLKIHDKNYTLGYSCEYCTHKARDNWNLVRHMFSHFQNSNSKNLNIPLDVFCPMQVEVSLTEYQVAHVRSSFYQISISKADEKVSENEVVLEDWSAIDEITAQSYGCLGLDGFDCSAWLPISSVLGLTPFEGFMSWVEYSKHENKEIFIVCVQERFEEGFNDSADTVTFIDNLFDDVCIEMPLRVGCSEVEAIEISKDILSEMIESALCSEVKAKYKCEICDKCFKDKTHLRL